jgi:hypothetical protein
MWMSIACELRELLGSEPDQAEASEALSVDIAEFFKLHWPNVYLEIP